MNIKKTICNILGHRWIHKNYSGYIKSDGAKYEFTVSRKCTRCNERAYLYDSWRNSAESELQSGNNISYYDKREINKVSYA